MHCSELYLTVHRATQTIGGNCIELRTGSGSSILLDIGRPLDAPPDAVGLLPSTLDLASKTAGKLVQPTPKSATTTGE